MNITFKRIIYSVSLLIVFSGRAENVDYNRDLQPILSGYCFNCHGNDDGSRKGKLRLDSREAALKGGKSDDHYGEPSKGVLSRPAFVIVQP